MAITPTFQPQNPAINGYSRGWQSCTCYAGAMAAAFDRQVKFLMSGEALRRKTGDTAGGTNLAQVDNALIAGWRVNLDVVYRMTWANFAKKINAGAGAVLQLWYAPIADSKFDAGNGFRANHAIFVPPTWRAMDPLADGRRSGVYKYHGEVYPQSLLRNAAGKLNLAVTGYRPLGTGLVYAAFTRDNVHTYALRFDGGERFWVYTLGSTGKITGRSTRRFTQDTSAPCSPPRRYDWPGIGTRTLAMVTKSTSSLYGEYVQVPQGAVHLEVFP